MSSVIILVIIGILLIAVNLNAVIKEKKSFKHQLHIKQDGIENWEIEISNIKKEFSETIIELKQEIQALKYEKENLNSGITLYNGRGKKVTENINLDGNKEDKYLDHTSAKIRDNKISNKNIVMEQDKDYVKNENQSSNNVKIDKIRQLVKEGMSVSEVSEKTGIDKGEVLLIKELYIE